MLNLNKIVIENYQGIELAFDTSHYCPSTFNLPCKYKEREDCYGNCVDCWDNALKDIDDFTVEWQMK